MLQLLEILSLSDVIMSDIENTFGRLGTFGNCKAQIDWFTHTSSNDPVSPSALRGLCHESSGFITCLCSFTVFNYCLLYWFSITHSQLFTRKCYLMRKSLNQHFDSDRFVKHSDFIELSQHFIQSSQTTVFKNSTQVTCNYWHRWRSINCSILMDLWLHTFRTMS